MHAWVQLIDKVYLTFAKVNKTGTSKVGAISKAQKAQFLKYEKLLFLNLRFLLTKAQYSSDLISKVRIERFSPDMRKEL